MKILNVLLYAIVAISIYCPIGVTVATEVKWTGNEADTAEGNSGPLPLSQQQRQQLLQLEDVIMKSSDPEATLKQAAEANQMAPQDLLSMLQRNRSDLEQGLAEVPSGGGGGMSSTVGGTLRKLLAALIAVLTKSASQNPKIFSIIATTLLLLVFLAVSAPRTGLVLSNQRGILSRGPTTILQPPTKFLEKRMGSAKWQQRDAKNNELSSDVWKDLALDQDGAIWHSLNRKSEVAKAATAQITIPITSFLEEGANDEEAIDFAMDLCYNHALDVLAARQFTEFTPDESISLHTLQKDEGRKRFAVLVVKKLGDLGRYGLVPLQVVKKLESDREAALTFSTLKGAPFTGQIHISAVQHRHRMKGGASSLVLNVHLAIPRKGNKISQKLGVKIVDSLATSISATVRTRTRQSLARQSQSSRFQGKAKARAEERRTSRFQKEKELEEMAEDRRRKWQRKNPNSGSYRPSGDMMKSPNNCVY